MRRRGDHVSQTGVSWMLTLRRDFAALGGLGGRPLFFVQVALRARLDALGAIVADGPS
jgi:hypothetical protein